jgi:hypothetical protein
MMKRPALAFFAIVLTSYAAWSGYYVARTSFAVEGENVFVLWDDAMVSMQYGSNLREGHGYVWMQDGDRVQGFVNHALTAVMALVHFLPIPDTQTSLAVQIIELCLLLGILLFTGRIANRLAPANPMIAVAAVLGTAVSAPLAIWCLQGADVGLISLWGLAAISMLAANRGAPGRNGTWPRGLAVLLPVGLLIRPDTLIPAFAILTLAAWNSDRPIRRFCVGAAAILGVAAAVLVIQKLYWGDWLPLPFYNKTTGVPRMLVLRSGLRQLGMWLPVVLPAVALAALGTWRNRRIAAVLASAAVIVLGVAYDFWVGGDWMAKSGSRFFSPWLPLLTLLSALGVSTLIEQLVSKRRLPPNWAGGATVALTLSLAIFANPGNTTAEWLTTTSEPMLKSYNERNFHRARYFRDRTEPDTKLALHWAGSPGYFSKRPSIELLGRTDEHIAKLDVPRFAPGHSKFDWDYAMSLEPDVFLAVSRGLGKRTDFRELYYRVDYPSELKAGFFFVRKTSAERLLDSDLVMFDQLTQRRVHRGELRLD